MKTTPNTVRREVASLRFNRAMDAWDYLEERGFVDVTSGIGYGLDFSHKDGRTAEVFRQEGDEGYSPVGLAIFEHKERSAA